MADLLGAQNFVIRHSLLGNSLCALSRPINLPAVEIDHFTVEAREVEYKIVGRIDARREESGEG